MYLQIIEQIKERIAVGDWPRGSEIPSIRQLAAALRVSVITVKRVYEELEREGVILTQQGKPSIVSGTADIRPVSNDDLMQQIGQVARLGTLLGFSPEELGARVCDATRKMTEEPQ